MIKYQLFGYHETVIRTRFGETDRYGYVWHGQALAYFEAARADLARISDLATSQLLEAGLTIPMVDLYCEYKKPAFEDEEIIVQTTLVKPIQKMPVLIFLYRIINKESGEELIRGKTKQLFTFPDTKITIRLPDVVKERLSRAWDYLADCPHWDESLRMAKHIS